MKSFPLFMLLMLSTTLLLAQARKPLRQGNEAYRKGDYEAATNRYQTAAQKDTSSYAAYFNLANALYQQKKFEEARAVNARAALKGTDAVAASNANYNIGNSHMEEKKWQEAIDAYKQTLRKNPADADAKYNLAYAQKMLKKEQQNKDKKQDENKEGNKDKKEDKDKQQEQDKDKEEEKKPEPRKEEPQKQEPKPQSGSMSKEQADKLLKALQEQEKKVQDKLRKGAASPQKNAKDW